MRVDKKTPKTGGQKKEGGKEPTRDFFLSCGFFAF